MCVVTAPFQHDYYTLWVGNDLIFTLPDDYVENVSLLHTLPEDAAIEFPLSMQGTRTVAITGGCAPSVSNGSSTVSLSTSKSRVLARSSGAACQS
jgi:hypothetical protein